ncbi:phage protein NinX family protein [Aeromonas sp.]|uniref:phage protein NinX family protein n=1 Tax=Aeromonas sp. TaxID=647 RepID=UPI00258C0A9C|nr:phage protein NinX family protein [Aeromonas sp.]MCX7132320.1 DUF2591 family protein [Aeromonas sp.]
MSNMVEVKTAELIGPALDWAVAKSIGLTIFAMGDNWPGNYAATITAAERPIVILCLIGRLWREHQGVTVPWTPSTDWAQGGPLIDKYRIWLSGPIFNRKDYSAAVDTGTDESRGTTALIALCRALVTAKLGDVVQVPADLVVEV